MVRWLRPGVRHCPASLHARGQQPVLRRRARGHSDRWDEPGRPAGHTYSETLVDIGTTALILPNAAFSALAAAVAANPVFKQNFGAGSFFSGTNCLLPSQGLTKAQLDAMLPALTLVVPSPTGKTVTIDLPATESYLLQQDDTQGNAYYCSGIESGSQTIIGANTLHTLITIFDRLHGQIGFAPQMGCPALGAATLARPPSAVTPAPPALPAPPYRHHRS